MSWISLGSPDETAQRPWRSGLLASRKDRKHTNSTGSATLKRSQLLVLVGLHRYRRALDEVAAVAGSERTKQSHRESHRGRRSGSCLMRPNSLSGSVYKSSPLAKGGLGRRLWTTCGPLHQMCLITCTTTPSSIGSSRRYQAAIRKRCLQGYCCVLCELFQRVLQEVLTTTLLADVPRLRTGTSRSCVENSSPSLVVVVCVDVVHRLPCLSVHSH